MNVDTDSSSEQAKTFIDKRRKVIATMKSIGATSRMVLGIFLTQVLAVAAMGVVLGLLLGTVAPVVLDALFGDMLPIQAEMTVTPGKAAPW